MEHYLGLTIGPVLKTLQQARKTRELWACSYLLSRLMKHLVDALGKTDVIIPDVPADLQNDQLFGAGIYPDRLFMRADKWVTNGDVVGAKKQVKDLIDSALRNLAEECLLDKEFGEAAVPFWKEFFRIRFVIKPLASINEGQLSLALSPFLETMELEDVQMHVDGENYLLDLFDWDKFSQYPLTEVLRSKGNYKWMHGWFPATHEVGAYELYKASGSLNRDLGWVANEDKNEEFYVKLESSNLSVASKYKPLHKYFCLVQADADNMGATIKQLADETAYRDFSQKLASYGADSATRINKFGGKPIYIGGDDLLFLCPVHNGEKTVFELIKELDDAFPKVIVSGVQVSMSFGLNIVYYKYPLFEAIADAYDIMQRAKKYKNASGDKKDAISFQFTKHSGNAFRATFSKGYLTEIQNLIKVMQGLGEKQAMVSSLIYKLQSLRKLFTEVLETPDAKTRLEATMKHYFNEWKNNEGFEKQRDAVIQLLLSSLQAVDINAEIAEPPCKQDAEKSTAAMDLFYHTMRLVQFMIAPSKNTKKDEIQNHA
jgi:CRISPR-associated protein Cmr2